MGQGVGIQDPTGRREGRPRHPHEVSREFLNNSDLRVSGRLNHHLDVRGCRHHANTAHRKDVAIPRDHQRQKYINTPNRQYIRPAAYLCWRVQSHISNTSSRVAGTLISNPDQVSTALQSGPTTNSQMPECCIPQASRTRSIRSHTIICGMFYFSSCSL